MSVFFPSLEAIEAADIRQIIAWNRRLPSPRNDDDVEALNAIVARMGKLKAEDPAAAVAASKSVGWD